MNLELFNLIKMLIKLLFISLFIITSQTLNTECNEWVLGAGSDGYNRFIQFSNNDTYYQIKTNYYIWYPTTIRNELNQIENITVYDSFKSVNLPNCGWFEISNVYKEAINTFNIYVLINENTSFPTYNLFVISKV